MALFKYTPSNFFEHNAVHLTCTTKQNEYFALCCTGGKIQETKTCILYIPVATLKVVIIYLIQNMADVSSSSPCMIKLLLPIVESGYNLQLQ